MTFGVSHAKDGSGSDSWRAGGLLARMVGNARDPALLADACVCECTDHGHCGALRGDHVHNDESTENLGLQAVIPAKAGANMVAPSAMMDGQVTAILRVLDDAGFDHLED